MIAQFTGGPGGLSGGRAGSLVSAVSSSNTKAVPSDVRVAPLKKSLRFMFSLVNSLLPLAFA